MAAMRPQINCVSIRNQTKATVVCQQARLADTFFTRLIGLLGKRQLSPGAGLLLQPSSGVHTWGMAFPIDIVALDRGYKVVGVWKNVGPCRVRGLSIKTRRVLELPAGQVDQAQIAVGDELRIAAVFGEVTAAAADEG